MTLVATSRSAGVPILVGDFLISRGDERRLGQKKILRLRRTLALGWTGNLVYASSAIRQMDAELSNTPSRKELEAWLSDYDPELADQQSLKLIGWLADGDSPTGFHWDGSASDVHWGDDWHVGSGGRAYEVFSKGYMVRPGSNGPEEREALAWLAGLLAHLNCGEMVAPDGHEIGVGGGFEALYWSFSEQSFKYVEDVMYFLVACRMDGNGRFREPPQAVDALRRYWTVDDCSVLSIAKSGGQDTGYNLVAMAAPGIRIEEATLDVLENERTSGPMWMGAAYYAGLLSFSAPHTKAPPVPIVACPWDTQTRIQGSRGHLKLGLPLDALEQVFQETAADYAQNPYPLTSIQIPSSMTQSGSS